MEYSPTSPPDDEDSNYRGAVLPVGRRVMVLTRSGPNNGVNTGQTEWILDSGAQVNVTGELSRLNNITDLSQKELLQSATGTFERAEVMGSVVLPVAKEHNGKVEARLLEAVRCCPGTKVNLISQTYMQFDGGFKLIMSTDHVDCEAQPEAQVRAARWTVSHEGETPKQACFHCAEAYHDLERHGDASQPLEPRQYEHH